jgi:hypothetical protein
LQLTQPGFLLLPGTQQVYPQFFRAVVHDGVDGVAGGRGGREV